ATIPTTLSGSPSTIWIIGRSFAPPPAVLSWLPGGRRCWRPPRITCDSLEAELHRALQGPGIAPLVADRDAMPPGAFDTEIDKRHRAPDQVRMCQVEFLVGVVAGGNPDIEGADVGMFHAEVDGRAQGWQPPMLVTDLEAEGGDWRAGNRGVVEPPIGREKRPAVGGVEGLAQQRAAEIGRDRAGAHRADHLADAFAGRRAPGQIVLAPGEEIAGQGAAITDPAAGQEHAVIQRQIAHGRPGLDMAPGLLDAPAEDEIGCQILRGVEEG